jgi:ArsR family transcriptional regulator, arsenate/arsenite/antimonite-responsive transcriptional repressor
MAVDVVADPTRLLKVLSDPVRWRIVERLAVEDLCVCHLVEALEAAQPLVSHHLRVLREAGVVTTEPCGAFTYYLLDRSVLASLSHALGALGRAPDAPRRRPCT